MLHTAPYEDAIKELKGELKKEMLLGPHGEKQPHSARMSELIAITALSHVRLLESMIADVELIQAMDETYFRGTVQKAILPEHNQRYEQTALEYYRERPLKRDAA